MQTEAIWYKQSFKDPTFRADVVRQFNTLKTNGVLANWLSAIATQAAALQQGQTNNFKRWPMLGIGVWPNAEAADSYGEEVNYFANYLSIRIAYLDSVFNGKTATASLLVLPGGTVYAGSPTTLTAHVTGGKSPTSNISFLANGILLGTTGLAQERAASILPAQS